MAISLEVAEHLPEEKSNVFIKSLCSLSDTILFSAAVPGQGGTNHINEKYPSYWAKLFKENEFYPLDLLRGVFWNDENIDYCYRQNIMHYINKKSILYSKLTTNHAPHPLDIIHPHYVARLSELPSLKTLLKRQYEIINIFPQIAKRAVKNRIR